MTNNFKSFNEFLLESTNRKIPEVSKEEIMNLESFKYIISKLGFELTSEKTQLKFGTYEFAFPMKNLIITKETEKLVDNHVQIIGFDRKGKSQEYFLIESLIHTLDSENKYFQKVYLVYRSGYVRYMKKYPADRDTSGVAAGLIGPHKEGGIKTLEDYDYAFKRLAITMAKFLENLEKWCKVILIHNDEARFKNRGKITAANFSL
jgi:hypothetical protein